jgi:rubrerythrin
MSDLISRQAAIDALKNRWKKTRNYEGNGDDIAEECELYLKQVPFAQLDLSGYSDKLWRLAYERGKREASAQRTGKWIAISKANPTASGFGISISHLYECDMCGHMSKARTPYCPNCGAKME